MRGEEEARKLFEFVTNPENTGVEWNWVGIGTPDKEKSIIGTMHDPTGVAVQSYLRGTGYTLRFAVHNHPSGYPRPSDADRKVAEQDLKRFPTIVEKIYVHPGMYFVYTMGGRVLSEPMLEGGNLPPTELKSSPPRNEGK